MYSQRDEEKYILEACKDSTNRRLLDVGAWDPKTFSNSRALIESGWGGLLIEFSPVPLRHLVEEYRQRADVEILAAAVAVELARYPRCPFVAAPLADYCCRCHHIVII